MVPPAPPRFSTTIDCPSGLLIFSATKRQDIVAAGRIRNDQRDWMVRIVLRYGWLRRGRDRTKQECRSDITKNLHTMVPIYNSPFGAVELQCQMQVNPSVRAASANCAQSLRS